MDEDVTTRSPFDNIILFTLLFLFFVKIFILPFISGYFILKNIEENQIDNFKVSMIQPNISLEDKRNIYFSQVNLDHLIEKSKECISSGTKLVVWPESALPFKELQNNRTSNYIINYLLLQNDI